MNKTLIILTIRVVLATFITLISSATQLTEKDTSRYLYDLNPIASFIFFPSGPTCNQFVNFDASSSYHTDPTHIIVTYEWDFHARDENDSFDTQAVGVQQQHKFTIFGHYYVRLRVTDDQGLTAMASKIINIISNIPPIANAGGPYTAALGSNVMLDGTGSYDAEEGCGDYITSYTWDINRDGVFGDATGPTPIIETTDGYFQVGLVYIISLRVTDALGLQSNEAETTLEITEPVPVELSSFSASVKGSSVALTWRTETEVNNYGFDIERKSLNEWQRIGFVQGHGNSNSSKEYSFTDSKLVGGNKFQYKLKQIDNDGQFEYSDIVEVEAIPIEYAMFQNYPNPFNPVTTISWQSPVSSWQTIKIFDVLGNEIATLVDEYKPAGRYEVEFNPVSSIQYPESSTRHLASGIYFYQLKAGPSSSSGHVFIDTKRMLLLK